MTVPRTSYERVPTGREEEETVIDPPGSHSLSVLSLSLYLSQHNSLPLSNLPFVVFAPLRREGRSGREFPKIGRILTRAPKREKT